LDIRNSRDKSGVRRGDKALSLIENSKKWLSESVLPLWSQQGFDSKSGSFVESLMHDGTPSSSPRRLMVQCRQIYSFTEASKLKLFGEDAAKEMAASAAKFLNSCRLAQDTGFPHAVDAKGAATDSSLDLYSQAFVLFGLARAYEVVGSAKIKIEALNLLKYLHSHRRAPSGGYVEVKDGQTPYQSNPHMHLFEALIEWCRVDSDLIWRISADEVFRLCTEKFLNHDVGCICEFFDEKWRPLEEDGKFLFEPGHQFEWAWLMSRYSDITGSDVGEVPFNLFELSEKVGVKSSYVLDEIWQDLTPKKESSRFWPQCERIKCAVSLGLKVPAADQIKYANAADEANQALFTYFETPLKGLWCDVRFIDGRFDRGPAKASSLYHIVGAISEYVQKRPKLKS
jgi:mannose-6-phosphate isomerase